MLAYCLERSVPSSFEMRFCIAGIGRFERDRRRRALLNVNFAMYFEILDFTLFDLSFFAIFTTRLRCGRLPLVNERHTGN